MTALLDIIGTTIGSTKKRFKDAADEVEPNHLMIVILTDGYEYASRKFNREKNI